MTSKYSDFIKNMPKMDNFKYWFKWTHDGLDIIDCDTWQKVGHTDAAGTSIDDGDALLSYEMFAQRPEYIVGRGFEGVPQEGGLPLENFKLDYELALLGCSLIRNQSKATSFDQLKESDNVIPFFERCIGWIESTDFFTAPASRGYHGSFTGGLLCHCLDVCNNIITLWRTGLFQQQAGDTSLDSAIMCALVHDWCKIGLYESYMRNVKNEQTGKWDKVPAFKYSDESAFVFGHGVSSMFLAGKFFKLTVEESLAIRWHMGRWQVGSCEESELQQSNQRYPLVYLLQFADQLSCTKYANQWLPS